MKKETTKLSITLEPEILTKIKDGNYNCNKLIINLLTKYSEKKKK
jgi:hypothetical protein